MNSPKSITGGSYFIKVFAPNQSKLYIQSPKCKTKQGIVKTGKKNGYTDLVFTQDDESFLKWLEQFEEYCQKILFDNKDKWFDSELEMHDIENSFSSSLKPYKSGKLYLLRANIPLHLGKCSLKIYNEQEQDVDSETINENTNIMTILEIQGIKCSSRSFHVEIEVKQIMVLNPVDIFETCVISRKKNNDTLSIKETIIPKETISLVNSFESKPLREEIEDTEYKTHETNNTEYPSEMKEVVDKTEVSDGNDMLETDIELKPVSIDLENNIESKLDICEIELPIPTISDSTDIVQLKARNDVYYKMYKEARQKAKIARNMALTAYLEAKRIKNTYLFDEEMDSESDTEDNDVDSFFRAKTE
jgi:hypothetical protein